MRATLSEPSPVQEIKENTAQAVVEDVEKPFFKSRANVRGSAFNRCVE